MSITINKELAKQIDHYYKNDLGGSVGDELWDFCRKTEEMLLQETLKVLDDLFSGIAIEVEYVLQPYDIALDNAYWSGWWDVFASGGVVLEWTEGLSRREVINIVQELLEAHGVRKTCLERFRIKTYRTDNRESYSKDNQYLWDIEVERGDGSLNDNRVYAKTWIKTGPHVSPWDTKSEVHPALYSGKWEPYDLKPGEDLDDVLNRISFALAISFDEDGFNEETEFWSCDKGELKERLQYAQDWYAGECNDTEATWCI